MTTEKKKYNEGRKALQVFLDEDTHVKFKALCAMRGAKMTQVIEMMVNQYVDEQTTKIDWLHKAIRDKK